MKQKITVKCCRCGQSWSVDCQAVRQTQWGVYKGPGQDAQEQEEVIVVCPHCGTEQKVRCPLPREASHA